MFTYFAIFREEILIDGWVNAATEQMLLIRKEQILTTDKYHLLSICEETSQNMT